MTRGLDYSASRIAGTAIKAAGFSFAIRYVDDPARGLSSKHIQPGEYADLRASGVQVWLVCERTVQDSQGGFASGAALAKAARKGADWIGYPPGGLIFFTADRHLLAAEVAKALAFLDGAASVLGHGAVGCYGFSELVNAASAQNKAAAYWLAGSKPNSTSPAHIWQRNDGFTTVGGISCDINEMLKPLPAVSPEGEDMAQVPQQQWDDVYKLMQWMWSQMAGQDAKPFEFTGWPSFPSGSGKTLTLVDYHRQADAQLEDVKRRLAAIESKLA